MAVVPSYASYGALCVQRIRNVPPYPVYFDFTGCYGLRIPTGGRRCNRHSCYSPSDNGCYCTDDCPNCYFRADSDNRANSHVRSDGYACVHDDNRATSHTHTDNHADSSSTGYVCADAYARAGPARSIGRNCPDCG